MSPQKFSPLAIATVDGFKKLPAEDQLLVLNIMNRQKKSSTLYDSFCREHQRNYKLSVVAAATKLEEGSGEGAVQVVIATKRGEFKATGPNQDIAKYRAMAEANKVLELIKI